MINVITITKSVIAFSRYGITLTGMHEGSNRSRDRGHHCSEARDLLEAGLNETAPAARGLWGLYRVGCGESPAAAVPGMVIDRHYGRIGRCVAGNQHVEPGTPRRMSAVVGRVASGLIDRDELARSDRGSAADCQGSAMTEAAVMSCHK